MHQKYEQDSLKKKSATKIGNIYFKDRMAELDQLQQMDEYSLQIGSEKTERVRQPKIQKYLLKN